MALTPLSPDRLRSPAETTAATGRLPPGASAQISLTQATQASTKARPSGVLAVSPLSQKGHAG